jgi:hypothetical protein
LNFTIKIFCNIVAAILYLRFVHIRRAIWFNRIAAGFLLLILALVTDIQVLHSHVSNNLFAAPSESLTKKSGLPECNTPGTDSRCFICEYQLTKDADAHYASFTLTVPVQYHSIVTVHYIFTPLTSTNSFETRGPPSMV